MTHSTPPALALVKLPSRNLSARLPAAAALPVVAYLQQHQQDVPALLQRFGLSVVDLYTTAAGIDSASLGALWSDAARVSPDAGLDAAGLWPVEMNAQMPVAGFRAIQAFAMSGCLRSALRVLVRYTRLFHPAGEVDVHSREDEVHLRFAFSERVGTHEEFWYTIVGRIIQQAIGRSEGLCLELRRSCTTPAIGRRRRSINVRWGCVRDVLVIPASDLDRPWQSDPHVSAYIQALESERQRLSEQSVVARVRTMIAWRLGERSLRLDHFAQALGVSPRTLCRRLDAEGVSFRQLLDSERAIRTRRLLLETSSSLDEIAASIGLADSSTLNRAFRRWYGVTPGAFRSAELSTAVEAFS